MHKFYTPIHLGQSSFTDQSRELGWTRLANHFARINWVNQQPRISISAWPYVLIGFLRFFVTLTHSGNPLYGPQQFGVYPKTYKYAVIIFLRSTNGFQNGMSQPVWPDWVIYWTLGNFLKPLATINLPKSPTFLGNFCKGVKIYNFSSEIIFGQLL